MNTIVHCPCRRGERPLGRLYRVDMGRGIVRLTTDPDCPQHNEHAFIGDATPTGGQGHRCEHCGEHRLAWIHPEQRRELYAYLWKYGVDA